MWPHNVVIATPTYVAADGSAGGERTLRPAEERPLVEAQPLPLAPLLRRELRELGYVEGRNLFIDYHYAEGNQERLRALAAELVQLQQFFTPVARSLESCARVVVIGTNPADGSHRMRAAADSDALIVLSAWPMTSMSICRLRAHASLR